MLRLRLLCADRVSNTTDITLALVPEDYEVKPGQARRYFTGPTFGYEWSEVGCDFMGEGIIDIDNELATLGDLNEGQGRLALVQSFRGYSTIRHK